jgi:malate synthase
MRRMFLNGTAMSGQKDHGAIAGATFLGPARTAPRFRFYAVRDAFPGLYPVPTGGASIEGELYELTEDILFGSLLPEEPAELEIGTIELDTGEIVNSMHLQPERIAAGDKVVDIADLGGWRAYQAALAAGDPVPEPSSVGSLGAPRATVRAALDESVLTPEVLDLVALVQRVHRPSLDALLERRTERAAAIADGADPGPDPDAAAVRAGDWQVEPAPPYLRDRRVEITGPADRKMMVSALNSGAQVFMADLEDSLSPTWANIVDGHANLRDAAAGTLTFTRPDGSIDEVGPDAATLVVRPRGLHLLERHVTVDGAMVTAALFDVAVAASHCADALTERGAGLALYLPKLEGRREAEWWDAVLADLERRLGLPVASIKVTVLVETILAAVEMDEILFALRERITGLNAGRWDYLFSIIKRFGTRADAVLPDRLAVTMTAPFMAAYASRLVAACHRRGAYAIGGMAAFVPNRRDPGVTERALAAVAADKQREAALGYDGTWVAHPDLVAVAGQQFAAVLGAATDQLDEVPDAPPLADVLTFVVPGAAATRAGLIDDVGVGLRYLASWLDGRGAVAINNLMEDAATAEIARSQLWQWIRHGTALDDGTIVTADVVAAEIETATGAVLAAGLDPGLVKSAAELLRDVTLSTDLVEFLTIPGSILLDDLSRTA